MAIWHVVRDGVVENVIEWDGVSDYHPGEGFELQQLGEQVGIGFALVDGEWRPPEEHQ